MPRRCPVARDLVSAARDLRAQRALKLPPTATRKERSYNAYRVTVMQARVTEALRAFANASLVDDDMHVTNVLDTAGMQNMVSMLTSRQKDSVGGARHIDKRDVVAVHTARDPGAAGFAWFGTKVQTIGAVDLPQDGGKLMQVIGPGDTVFARRPVAPLAEAPDYPFAPPANESNWISFQTGGSGDLAIAEERILRDGHGGMVSAPRIIGRPRIAFPMPRGAVDAEIAAQNFVLAMFAKDSPWEPLPTDVKKTVFAALYARTQHAQQHAQQYYLRERIARTRYNAFLATGTVPPPLAPG